jgi:hypothetical protein
MAYESNIIPTQRLMAAEISARLLPDFEASPDDFVAGFDLSRVRVLQEDRLKVVQRVTLAVGGGLMKVSEGRREIGQPVSEEDEIYLRPVNLVAVATGEAASTTGEDRAAAVRLVSDLGLALARLGLASSYGVISTDTAAALAGVDAGAGASANGNGGSGDA